MFINKQMMGKENLKNKSAQTSHTASHLFTHGFEKLKKSTL